MVAAVSAAFASTGLRFMVDLEQLYDYENAVRMGRALSDMPCDWLEAPLDDTAIDAYAELRRTTAEWNLDLFWYGLQLKHRATSRVQAFSPNP
jgi:L-alanine-DL-glutamate epimerase-like enolase superfamily enzyme